LAPVCVMWSKRRQQLVARNELWFKQKKIEEEGNLASPSTAGSFSTILLCCCSLHNAKRVAGDW
jgi:hypothetical protein